MARMRGALSLVLAAFVAGGSLLAAQSAPAATATAAPGASKPRQYTLAECLALAERNHPNLWAARARIDGFRAQLDEAHWTPFWQWSGGASLTSIADARGAAPYTTATSNALNTSFADGFNPWFRMNLSGGIPLYTFGKIDWIGRAAEAQVRAGEWESEKFRQQTRADVRRAYYGVMLGRDMSATYVEMTSKIDKVLASITEKLERGDPGVDEGSRARLDIYRDTLEWRAGDPRKRETVSMSTLRFMTGVQTDFDVVHAPLGRPEGDVAPVVTYLTAARLYRPDTNQARAGIAARRAQLEFAQARLFPDIALGFGAGINIARNAEIQNGWVFNPFNSNGFYFGGPLLRVQWTPDILPGLARIEFAAAQLEEVRALQRLALGGVAVEVENAYGVVLETRQREDRFGHAEGVTKRWLEKVQGEVERGAKDTAALTEPLQLYLEARVNHLYALVDYDIALAELARVTGWDAAATPGAVR
ncbi:TolC family protein [Pendulispora brunnea]|uniref:TolC family protein n=1 Tax=Pendulispora brunnea TaxID=2905690 RepID=A0ABZ2KJJ8_9BACT